MNFSELQHHFGTLGGRYEPAEVSRSYSTVAAVYACVRWRAENLAGMPLMLVTPNDEVVESGPAAELTACPNSEMTARSFWQATSSLLDLSGALCWVFTLDALDHPIEVRPVARTLMRADLDRSSGRIRRWFERDPVTGLERELRVEEMWLIRDPDFDQPSDPLSALSPRSAVRRAIAQLHLSDLSNERSIASGASGGMLFQTDQNLTEPQERSLLQQLQDRHAGPLNRHTWMLLQGGLKAEPLGSTFRDMEFAEMRKFSRDDVCVAFGIGPATIGYFSDSNYAHAEASDRATWINTMLPYSARLAEEWSRGVLSRWADDRSMRTARRRTAPLSAARGLGFASCRKRALTSGMGLYAYFDSSGVPAVQRAQLELAQSAETWVRNGVPMADVIRATDAPFPADESSRPWMHTWWVELGRRDVKDDALSIFNDPPGPGTPAPGSPAPGSDLGDDPDPTDPQDGRARRRIAKADADTLRTTEAQRAELWAAWRASWAGLERRMRGGVSRHFMELRTATLKRLEAEFEARSMDARGGLASGGGVSKRNLVGAVLFDLAEAQGKLWLIVGPLLREAQRLGGSQTMREAADAQGGDPTAFNLDDPQAVEALRRRVPKVAGVDVTVQRRIAQALAEGLDAGEGLEALSTRVKGVFKQAAERASMIARTEVGAAVEEGRDVARVQAGVPLKSWLWSRRETGRASHAQMERETMANPIPVGELFVLASGASCKHPRATGRPVEDINCGCTALSRYPNDSLRSFLDRYTSRGFLSYEQLDAPSVAKDAA
ncbi:MAG: phage portal protein [Planctomycetota bacterium]